MQRRRGSSRPEDALKRRPLARLPWWLAGLSRLPMGVLHGLASMFALLAGGLVGYRRAVVEAQIRRCFPDWTAGQVRETRRGFYRHFLDVMVESFKALTHTAQELDARMSIEGFEAARRYLDTGRSVVLVTAHTGNWEWALQSVSLHIGHPTLAAYKPLHQPFWDSVFLLLRGRFGAQMAPDRRLLRQVLRGRGQPRLVAMVADQDPTLAAARRSATFLGQPTWFFMGPELVCRTLDAPLLYAAVTREGRGRYHLRIELLGDPRELPGEGELLSRFVSRVERHVRERPADWLWGYRRWKKRGGA